jgi:hypothetical protein
MRKANILIQIDITDSPHSDAFWDRYFKAWAERCPCPTVISSVINTESETPIDEPVILLRRRKGITHSKTLADVPEGWTL